MWIIVVVMLSCTVDVFYHGMHRCECMNGYMSTYVTYMYHWSMFGCNPACWLHSCMLGYMYHSCRLISSIVHSCLIICVYAYVWMVMNHLCMLMFACGQVYSDVMMVAVMHEVVVCIVVEVMH